MEVATAYYEGIFFDEGDLFQECQDKEDPINYIATRLQVIMLFKILKL